MPDMTCDPSCYQTQFPPPTGSLTSDYSFDFSPFSYDISLTNEFFFLFYWQVFCDRCVTCDPSCYQTQFSPSWIPPHFWLRWLKLPMPLTFYHQFSHGSLACQHFPLQFVFGRRSWKKIVKGHFCCITLILLEELVPFIIQVLSRSHILCSRKQSVYVLKFREK